MSVAQNYYSAPTPSITRIHFVQKPNSKWIRNFLFYNQRYQHENPTIKLTDTAMTAQKNVMVVQWASSNHLDIADLILADPCADIKYWITPRKLIPLLQDNFPAVIFHSHEEASHNIPANDLVSLKRGVIDKKVIDFIGSDWLVITKLLDRLDAARLNSFESRIFFANQAIEYWATVLDQLKIDYLIFPTTPHDAYTYIIYCVARYKNLNTRIIRKTFSESRVVVDNFITSPSQDLNQFDFVDGSVMTESDLSSDILENIQKLRSNSYASVMPSHVKKFYLASGSKLSPSLRIEDKRALKYLQLSKHPISFLVSLIQVRSAQVKRLLEGQKTYPRKHRLKHRRVLFKTSVKRLVNFYEKKSIKELPSSGYLYCALHYTPENTNCPGGHTFFNQELMIMLLARAAPPGVRVLVKEHRSMFMNPRPGGYDRDLGFYQRICSLKNVDLVSLECDPLQLIDGALAVATQTGTVGWEASVRGVPALIFGYPWYLPCGNAFPVASEQDIVSALKEVKKVSLAEKYYNVLSFAFKLDQCSYSIPSEGHSRRNLQKERNSLLELKQRLLT